MLYMAGLCRERALSSDVNPQTQGVLHVVHCLAFICRQGNLFSLNSHLSWQLNAPVELLNGHEAGIGEPAGSVLLTQTPDQWTIQLQNSDLNR